jgi:hypothetical protein
MPSFGKALPPYSRELCRGMFGRSIKKTGMGSRTGRDLSLSVPLAGSMRVMADGAVLGGIAAIRRMSWQRSNDGSDLGQDLQILSCR